MRRLISVDPLTGTRTYMDYDESEDALHFIEEVDVTALLEMNKAMFNDAPSGWADGATAARLPPMLRMKLQRDGIATDDKLWRKWLNDPDHRGFRIRPGRI